MRCGDRVFTVARYDFSNLLNRSLLIWLLVKIYGGYSK